MGGMIDSSTIPMTTGNVTVYPSVYQSGSNTGDYWQYPWSGGYYVPYQQVVAAPAECSGDVHVFPCPHCDKCKCGGATKNAKGKAKR